MLFTDKTSRLILKIENEDKAPEVLAFYQRNRAHFTPFEPQVSDCFYSLAYQQKMLAYEFEQTMRGNAIRYYMYLADEPDRIIGSVNLSQIVHSSFCRATLGYKLDYEMQGQGYATEAVSHLISLAAQDLKLHRLEAHVIPENTRSIRLLDRLQFQQEGMEYQSVKVDGAWRDLLRYGLLLY